MRIEQSAFGGFCARVHKEGEYAVYDPDGKVTLPNPHYLKPETNWPAKDWYAGSITLDKGKTIGLAVLDHPKNAHATWHNARSVGMLNPCPTAAGPITLEKGKPFVLRYRLVAHDGPTPVDVVRALSAEWRRG